MDFSGYSLRDMVTAILNFDPTSPKGVVMVLGFLALWPALLFCVAPNFNVVFSLFLNVRVFGTHHPGYVTLTVLVQKVHPMFLLPHYTPKDLAVVTYRDLRMAKWPGQCCQIFEWPSKQHSVGK